MSEQMTAAEARAYLVESEENRVKDRKKYQWRIHRGRLEFWNDSRGQWCAADNIFEDYAPFTIHRTKRQLREECEALTQRAEEAEHNLKNLLARIFRDGGHQADSYATLREAAEQADLEAAEYIIGYGDVLRRAEAAEARVKELEHDAYAVGYNAGVARIEAQLATITAERDALASRVAWLEALLPAETPPTLAEFRESGERCVITYNSIDVDTPVFRSAIAAYRDGFWWIGAAHSMPEHSIVAIARMPRFYPVEGKP